jgi:hypothetical protein
MKRPRRNSLKSPELMRSSATRQNDRYTISKAWKKLNGMNREAIIARKVPATKWRLKQHSKNYTTVRRQGIPSNAMFTALNAKAVVLKEENSKLALRVKERDKWHNESTWAWCRCKCSSRAVFAKEKEKFSRSNALIVAADALFRTRKSLQSKSKEGWNQVTLLSLKGRENKYQTWSKVTSSYRFSSNNTQCSGELVTTCIWT